MMNLKYENTKYIYQSQTQTCIQMFGFFNNIVTISHKQILTNIQTDRLTNRPTDRETDRQTGRQTDTLAHKV